MTAMQVLRRFRVVFNAVKTHFQQVEKQAGIGGAQLWALGVVREQPGIGVMALADAMDIHQSTASNLVRTLVQSGLLLSERGQQDRRQTQLRLTPDGESLVARAPGPFTGVLPEALSRLSPEVLGRLDEDLGVLIAELQADPADAQRPLASL